MPPPPGSWAPPGPQPRGGHQLSPNNRATGRDADRHPAGARVPAASGTSRHRGWLGGVALLALVFVIVLTSNNGDERSRRARAASRGLVGGDFHSLVADPTTPGRLFVGGHRAVSVSSDGGRSWSSIDSLENADAMGWAFAEGTIYVTGHPGISRSSDGGASFEPSDGALPDTDVHAFGAAGELMYAAGPTVGVLASEDGGRSWTARTQDSGQTFFGRILMGPDGHSHLLAADARAGVMESTDRGGTWHRLGGPGSAVWLSRSGDTVYVSGPRGAARSGDGGRTWEELALPEGASLVEADPSDPAVLYAGIHSGDRVRVMVSRDGGSSWSRP